jgi:hypothetical protein
MDTRDDISPRAKQILASLRCELPPYGKFLDLHKLDSVMAAAKLPTSKRIVLKAALAEERIIAGYETCYAR